MASAIESKVVAIIAAQAVLDVSEIGMDATLESLGLDSMGLVECIFAIEEAFDISVPFNANDPADSGFDLTSVGSVVRAVEGLIAARP